MSAFTVAPCGSFSGSAENQPILHNGFHALAQETRQLPQKASRICEPFQNPLKLRPNPRYFRPATLFNVLDIQHERYLSEEEVLEINYITKKRAFRYIAAAEEEWLYPEQHLQSTNWRKFPALTEIPLKF